MTTPVSIDALEIRSHLLRLEAERALAVLEGLDGVRPYMADLHAEMELGRELYLAAAVTEIATLRAELSGPLVG